MSILQRIRDLMSAHANAVIDRAEDPELMATQTVRAAEDLYEKFQVEFNKAVADQQIAQNQLNTARAEVQKWADYAEKAVAQNRDDLAREALGKKVDAEGRIPHLEQVAAQYTASVEDLRKTGQQLRDHIEQLRQKRQDLISRAHAAQAKEDAGKVARQLDPTALSATMNRLEEKVTRKEAAANASLATAQEATADPFKALDAQSRTASVEAELARLKQQKNGSQ